MKTFKELILYLTKGKKPQNKEGVATILHIGKVTVAAVSFVHCFPRPNCGAQKCGAP